MMIRWALVPLYPETGDPAYLDASVEWCLEKGRMLESFNVPPHYHRYDEDRFNERILNETCWDPEGHAALFEVTGDDRFREIGKEFMDHHMRVFQREDGSRSFIFNRDPADVGISEKGTALWSLLFYQLHQATGNKAYLEAARSALRWCLENQYTGPDTEAIGGIVGSTPASIVGVRAYFPASCAYSTGFFGLAILEELKLMVPNN